MATAPVTLAEVRIELRAQVVGNDTSPVTTIGTITVPVTATQLEGDEGRITLRLDPSTDEIRTIVEQLTDRLTLVPVQQ